MRPCQSAKIYGSLSLRSLSRNSRRTNVVFQVRPKIFSAAETIAEPARAKSISPSMVEHPVDDDAGDRNVEPDRQRPPRDSPVAVEASPERERQRHDRENRNRG